MDIKEIISNELKNAFLKCGFDENLAIIQNSNKPELCDYQCNASFALAKKLGRNPKEIAEQIIANLSDLEKQFEVAFAMPAFINFKIKTSTYSEVANEILKDETLGVRKHKNSKSVLFDYGGANVAKSLHIGHLRSPIIGESLKRLYALLGHKVASDTHLGDWGTPLGLTIAQLEEDGFFDGDKQLSVELLNEAYPKASLRKKSEPDFKKKADNITLAIQQKKQPYHDIWKKIVKISIDDIKKSYDKLGAHFDFWFGESHAAEYVPEVVEIFKNQNMIRESEGAHIVDVANENENIPTGKKNEDGSEVLKNVMPPLILQKTNGGEVYATYELATILMRNKTGKWDELFYITDDRQNLHFEQCFRAVKKSGISPQNQELIHVGFGTICGADGKAFKTRSGDTIKLDDMINMAKDKALQKLAENGIKDNEQLAEIIGIGALKFGDLSNDVTKNYVLDMDKMTSFEGKTGPYLQYTMARINSILTKAAQLGGEIKIETEEEKKIILEILKLIDAYEICYQNKSLHTLCLAAYNVASAFSTFYNNIKILSEQNEARRNSLISLCKLVQKSLKQALGVLAIDVPEKM